MVTLEEIFSSAKSLYEEEIIQFGINYNFKCDAPHLKIPCQKRELVLAIVGVVKNSIEAITNLEKPWINIELTTTVTEIIIRITDSGLGINPDIQVKIFDPFFSHK